MYTREQHNYRDGIPDNYSGIAMGESGRKQEYREHIPEREREQARDCPPPQRRGHPSRDEDCDRPREDCPPLSCDDECTQKGDCQSKNDECFSPPTMDDGCFSPAHHRERDAREVKQVKRLIMQQTGSCDINICSIGFQHVSDAGSMLFLSVIHMYQI